MALAVRCAGGAAVPLSAAPQPAAAADSSNASVRDATIVPHRTLALHACTRVPTVCALLILRGAWVGSLHPVTHANVLIRAC